MPVTGQIKSLSRQKDDFVKFLLEFQPLPTIGKPFHFIINKKTHLHQMYEAGENYHEVLENAVYTAITQKWIRLAVDKKIPTGDEEKKLLDGIANGAEVSRNTLINQGVEKAKVNGTWEKIATIVEKRTDVTFSISPQVLKLKNLTNVRARHIDKVVHCDVTVIGVGEINVVLEKVITDTGKTVPVKDYNKKEHGEAVNGTYRDVQINLVEEVDERPAENNILRKIPIKIYNNLVAKYKIGDKLRIAGYYKPKDDEATIDEKSVHLDVIAVSPLDKDDDIVASDDLITKMKEMATVDPTGYLKYLTSSLAPQIHENYLPKLGCMVGFVGGSLNLEPDHRHNINVILVGNPGTGKSDMIKALATLSKKSVYIDAPNASARGLLYGQEDYDKRKILRAGIMIRYEIICLDELDKMKEAERKELNTAMEQQIAMYHKNPFDIETKINATIIAAANPNSDVWIADRSLMDNMQPLETTIVSRCLLIKVERGTNTHDRLSHVIERMEGNIVEEDKKDILTHEELSGLLNHCKELNPELTKQAQAKFIQFMTEFEKVEQNELADMPIDARKELDLLRVATAITKLLLRDEVNIECINIAIKFYEECMASVGMDTTNPILQTNVRGEFENKTQEFFAICRKLETDSPDDAFTEAEILKALSESEHWPTRESASFFWSKMKQTNKFYEPKAGFYKRVN